VLVRARIEETISDAARIPMAIAKLLARALRRIVCP
jgi:hypothetical protein